MVFEGCRRARNPENRKNPKNRRERRPLFQFVLTQSLKRLYELKKNEKTGPTRKPRSASLTTIIINIKSY